MTKDDNHDLTSSVTKWLGTQGYPLEMHVASAFLKAGFRTFQADYYEDPETGAHREIDVIAYAQDEIDGCLVRLTLCVECKVAKDKPWVLLTSPCADLADPARVVQRAASQHGRLLLQHVARDRRFQNLQLLQLPDRPAFGVIQAFTSGSDQAYTACMSAAKATAAVISEADLANKRQGPNLEIALPIVVIDGHLLESFLTESHEMTVNEVFDGTLVWRNPLVSLPHTIIRIVTLQFLPKFIQEVKAAADLFLNSTDAIRQILSSARLRNSPRTYK